MFLKVRGRGWVAQNRAGVAKRGHKGPPPPPLAGNKASRGLPASPCPSQRGDEVQCEIEELGTICNKVV